MEVALTWMFLGTWAIGAVATTTGWLALAVRGEGEVSLRNE